MTLCVTDDIKKDIRITHNKSGFIVRVGDDPYKPFFVFDTLNELFDFIKEHYARDAPVDNNK